MYVAQNAKRHIIPNGGLGDNRKHRFYILLFLIFLFLYTYCDLFLKYEEVYLNS